VVGNTCNTGNTGPAGSCTCNTTVFGAGTDLFLRSSSNVPANNFVTQNGQNSYEREGSYVVYGNVTSMRLTVVLDSAPAINKPAVLTVRKNGVNTALSVTISNPSIQATAVLTNLTFTTFDLISLRMTAPNGDPGVFVGALISY
jgi:hypothetical protein